MIVKIPKARNINGKQLFFVVVRRPGGLSPSECFSILAGENASMGGPVKTNNHSLQVEKKLAEPVNDVIEKMYLQINNIVQGFVISILIGVLAKLDWPGIIASGDFAVPLFSFTSFFISLVFWSRYYFDTIILKRSFGVFAMVWFFLYIVAEGISFAKIGDHAMWLISTGIFLFFGAGFYVLNILEINRKRRNKMKIYVADNDVGEYLVWQKKRLIDLVCMALLSLSGAYLVMISPSLAAPAGLFSLFFALWQLGKSADYRKLSFLKTGL